MKYFTKEWVNGNLSDEECDCIRKEYLSYMNRVKESLPLSVRSLATEINIHDGLFTSVIMDTQNILLKLELLIGDLQVGYEDLTLKYSDVDFSLLDTSLLETLANSSETEALYDEVEDVGNGLYQHRIIFWPGGHLCIQFKNLEVQRVPRKDREIAKNNKVFKKIT